ncbi:hypothetical protein ACF0H5_000977 [Mactra antiquata]
MSWCVLQRLLSRNYNTCLPRKVYRSYSYVSYLFSNNNFYQCDTLKNIYKISNVNLTRKFSTTKTCTQQIKATHSFDEFYTAVEESNASLEDLKIFKFLNLSDNPTERDIQIKRWMFVEAVDLYVEKTTTPQAAGLRRGHIEFLTQALGRMKELGVARDIECYKALIKVFPPDIMVPMTLMQMEFYHYPKQQEKAMELLEQMEDNAVIPDQETRDLLTARFGPKGHVVRRVRKMIYWLRKFQNTNPYKLPHHLPNDPLELALLALKKISVDLENEIKVFNVTEGNLKFFIASAQSPMQCEMIKNHPVGAPMYVEGGFRVWLRDKCQTYFILRADSDSKLFELPTEDKHENLDDFETMFDAEKPKDLTPKPNIHQQEDGTILGMCITENATKDSLISWIRCLQDANPNLSNIPIVFTLRSPEEEKIAIEGDKDINEDIVPAS